MAVIENYIESNGSETPISTIEVFNSMKQFGGSVTISQSRAFYGDCVVEVWFEPLSDAPNNFIYYDVSGNVKYKGNRWKT